ncbi:MAG: TetR/AcrR family transcriptional regulator [Clostridiales bacterium]|nr:TetR/AcrR family transcriptional regulator [Candidatus Blautia equi]
MEQIVNDKILAMYRAVWDLTREGQNVYNMKVVDITNRAGIGKGTAYEYFRSKEELVAKALRYGTYLEYEHLLERIQAQDTLKDALNVCFSWLEEDEEKMACLLQFLKNSGAHEEIIRKGMKCMQENMEEDAKKIQFLLQLMADLGKKEGTICRETADPLVCLQILSQLMGYFTYRKFHKGSGEEEDRKVREFLYKSLENGVKQ